MKRLLSEIYELYKESINDDFELFYDYKLEQFEIKPEFEIKPNRNVIRLPKTGDLYLINLNGTLVEGLIINDEDDYLTISKVSVFYMFATQNDMISVINNQTYVIELWNKFYLTKNELLNEAVFIDSINKQDLQIISDYLDEGIEKLPENKRGITIPVGNYDFIQNKFQRDEAKLVHNYAIWLLAEDVGGEIYLNKKKFKSSKKVTAGTLKDFSTADDFHVSYNEKEHKLEFVMKNKKYIGQNVFLKIVNQYFAFTNLKKEFEIYLDEEIKQFSLISLVEKIEIGLFIE